MGWQSGWAVATSNRGRGLAHVYRVDTRKGVAQISCKTGECRTASLRIGKIGTRIGASKRLTEHPGSKCRVCLEIAHRAVRVAP